MTVLADDSRAVKAELTAAFAASIDELFAAADSTLDLRGLERAVVAALLSRGRLILSYLFALRCRRATEKDLSERGRKAAQVRLRFDEDYWTAMMTTMGPVHFPLFAYREEGCGATITRTPARDSVVPYRGRCRSSPLCLEWEVRLGAQNPFRRAEAELAFFTHGAATAEDTTISRHLVQISKLVDRRWTYLSPAEIREVLRERATRDRKNGKPLIYASGDAHALRRYTDFGALIEMGVLARQGDYGDGVRAQLVWVSDAMGWFDEHLLRLFPHAVVILDIFHLLRWFAVLGAKLFGAASQHARQLYAEAAAALGFERVGERPAKARRGHHKHARRGRRHAYNHCAASRFPAVRRGAAALAKARSSRSSPPSRLRPRRRSRRSKR